MESLEAIIENIQSHYPNPVKYYLDETPNFNNPIAKALSGLTETGKIYTSDNFVLFQNISWEPIKVSFEGNRVSRLDLCKVEKDNCPDFPDSLRHLTINMAGEFPDTYEYRVKKLITEIKKTKPDVISIPAANITMSTELIESLNKMGYDVLSATIIAEKDAEPIGNITSVKRFKNSESLTPYYIPDQMGVTKPNPDEVKKWIKKEKAMNYSNSGVTLKLTDGYEITVGTGYISPFSDPISRIINRAMQALLLEYQNVIFGNDFNAYGLGVNMTTRPISKEAIEVLINDTNKESKKNLLVKLSSILQALNLDWALADRVFLDSNSKYDENAIVERFLKTLGVHQHLPLDQNGINEKTFHGYGLQKYLGDALRLALDGVVTNLKLKDISQRNDPEISDHSLIYATINTQSLLGEKTKTEQADNKALLENLKKEIKELKREYQFVIVLCSLAIPVTILIAIFKKLTQARS